jgi:predicted DNA-binding protein with PD1-like motif
MTHSFDGYNYLVRLEKGERLSEALEQFFAESKIEGAWVSGLGAASDVELGFFQLNSKDYKRRKFGSMMEIVSLTGNLARDDKGKIMFHLHGAFADDDFQTIGGHVKDFIAGATVELFIHRSYKPMQRKFNDETGLQLLDLAS